MDIELDGTGFRILVGPYAGFLATPQLDSEGGLRVGAMAETWFSGRFGLQLLGDIGIGQSYQHLAVGPTMRALFPVPGLALPISLRADMLHHRDGGLTVFPSLAADLRICAGKATALRIGGHGGYGPRGGFLGGMSVGVTWRSNSPWKGEE